MNQANPVAAQPAQADQHDSRAAFEVHFQRSRGLTAPPERVGAGYSNGLAQDAWLDWQAGAANTQQQVVAAVSEQGIIDCFTKAGVWLGVAPDEVARNVMAVKHALVQFGARSPFEMYAGTDERVPGIAHPTTYAELTRLTPMQLWNRWYPRDRSLNARDAFVAARTIGFAPGAPRRKSENEHRADFELALKGNSLKRFHTASHAAYMNSLIENMWRGWLRKASFDGATLY
jgi:hypothetical protein